MTLYSKVNHIMLVKATQCAAKVTEFGLNSVETVLCVLQGVVHFLSIIGTVL